MPIEASDMVANARASDLSTKHIRTYLGSFAATACLCTVL